MRTAKFTTPAQDEVQLNYIIEASPSSMLHGTPGIAFYSIECYRSRQTAHGVATYPEPQPVQW